MHNFVYQIYWYELVWTKNLILYRELSNEYVPSHHDEQSKERTRETFGRKPDGVARTHKYVGL